MKLVNKIVRGNDLNRATRFHDENNQFIGWGQLRYFPYSVGTSIWHRATGKLPELPWWPFPVILKLENLIEPTWHVLEFGCGISSIWLAKRAAKVHSIEGSAAWSQKIKSYAKNNGIDNLTIELRDSSLYPDRGKFSDEFNSFFSDVTDFMGSSFDLVIVDGAARFLCVRNSLPLIKQGGFLYLDNSDADKDWAHYTDPKCSKLAQSMLQEWEAKGYGNIEYFRGLSPATPHASEGLLFHRNLKT
jgi:hypothetical protein